MRMLAIHQSLHRHNHVLGAERELVLMCGLLGFLVGFGGFSLLSCGSGIVFYIVSLLILRRMAKSDPIMSKVWMRHIKQQFYYPAKTSRWRINTGKTW